MGHGLRPACKAQCAGRAASACSGCRRPRGRCSGSCPRAAAGRPTRARRRRPPRLTARPRCGGRRAAWSCCSSCWSSARRGRRPSLPFCVRGATAGTPGKLQAGSAAAAGAMPRLGESGLGSKSRSCAFLRPHCALSLVAPGPLPGCPGPARERVRACYQSATDNQPALNECGCLRALSLRGGARAGHGRRLAMRAQHEQRGQPRDRLQSGAPVQMKPTRPFERACCARPDSCAGGARRARRCRPRRCTRRRSRARA